VEIKQYDEFDSKADNLYNDDTADSQPREQRYESNHTGVSNADHRRYPFVSAKLEGRIIEVFWYVSDCEGWVNVSRVV
jgi:hypothetical protein